MPSIIRQINNKEEHGYLYGKEYIGKVLITFLTYNLILRILRYSA